MSDNDDLQAQVVQLSNQQQATEQTLTDAAARFDELRQAYNALYTAHRTLRLEFKELQRRFNSFHPERAKCPHCGAVVHKAARACKACGRTWGRAPDPEVGLPDEPR